MNDKERLVRLDEAWGRKSSDYEWLLKQARLAREYAEIIDSQNESLTKFMNENQRYREALEKIANHETYGLDVVSHDFRMSDVGKLARQALERG